MHDIRWIRDNPQQFDDALKLRGMEPQAAAVLAMDEARRTHVANVQAMQERRNVASKEVGKAKASGEETLAARLIAEVAGLKDKLKGAEEEEHRLTEALEVALATIPNLALPDVPVGEDEDANQLLHTKGIKPTFNFEPKQHFELGEHLGLMDFETAASLAGARFVVLKGKLARLERALAQFMLDLHINDHGYEEIVPPLLVRDEVVYGTGQLPKFADDLFRTEDGRWLIPTAEVPLTGMVREQVLDAEQLPLRVTALTPCFRSEAGASGRDTRGMLRQHQFSKVELVSITDKDSSIQELERMLSCAEAVLEQLDVHYQVVTLSTGDMGFGAAKTYDIEVWLPGQGAYREISSCSVCLDFQARRMNARYRPKEGGPLQPVHTLNGSGVAVGRALIAIMENYQTEDGSILVPEVLQPYMGGITQISA